jgi:hypothetical protein
MSTLSKLEALADAIIAHNNYALPDHPQYQFRNPLGLQMFCPHALYFKNCPECKNGGFPTEHPTYSRPLTKRYDMETGLRIYNNHIQGYQSGIEDLRIKCSGRSKSKVRDTSTIKELIRSYCLPDGTAQAVARFLRKALKDDSITEKTPIGYFLAAEGRAETWPTATAATQTAP